MTTKNLIVKETQLLTDYGLHPFYAFRWSNENTEHSALVLGEPARREFPLVRIHSSCTTSQDFGSEKCDCRYQWQKSLEMMLLEGTGVRIRLEQEGRGHGLLSKVEAYELQRKGLNTYQADLALGLPVDSRNYDIAIAFLKYINIQKCRLLSGNQQKVQALRSAGLDVVELPIPGGVTLDNLDYILAKIEFGHDPACLNDFPQTILKR